MSVNKRAGREKELREKLKKTTDRYESVFGHPLSVTVLKEFLDHSEKHNVFTFLTDRVGVLSDQDVAYLRNVLSENAGNASTVHIEVDEDALDSIEEIGEEGFSELG